MIFQPSFEIITHVPWNFFCLKVFPKSHLLCVLWRINTSNCEKHLFSISPHFFNRFMAMKIPLEKRWIFGSKMSRFSGIFPLMSWSSQTIENSWERTPKLDFSKSLLDFVIHREIEHRISLLTVNDTLNWQTCLEKEELLLIVNFSISVKNWTKLINCVVNRYLSFNHKVLTANDTINLQTSLKKELLWKSNFLKGVKNWTKLLIKCVFNCYLSFTYEVLTDVSITNQLRRPVFQQWKVSTSLKQTCWLSVASTVKNH